MDGCRYICMYIHVYTLSAHSIVSGQHDTSTMPAQIYYVVVRALHIIMCDSSNAISRPLVDCCENMWCTMYVFLITQWIGESLLSAYVPASPTLQSADLYRQSPFPETGKGTERLAKSPSKGGFSSMRVDLSAGPHRDKKCSPQHEVVHIQTMMYTHRPWCTHTHTHTHRVYKTASTSTS